MLEKMRGRAMMVRWQRPDQLAHALDLASVVVGENGAFGIFKSGEEMRDWAPYYAWLEPWLFQGPHWAIIPDAIAEGSQAQDALIRDWPFGEKGAPVWHTDEPLDRLLRLVDEWPRVCVGATGDHWEIWKPGRPGKEMGDSFRQRIEEIAEIVAKMATKPNLHGLRMVAVAAFYPDLFETADASTIGQNAWRHRNKPMPLFPDLCGGVDYADKLELRAR